MKTYLILFIIFSNTLSAVAEPYIPDDHQLVVAKISATHRLLSQQNTLALSEQELLEQTKQLIDSASFPGQSRYYEDAYQLLSTYIEKYPHSNELALLWAHILQHDHRFQQAADVLNDILQRDPRHINANLMAARLAIVANAYQDAKKYCTNLLGVSDLISASACLLDVASHNGQLVESYTQLRIIIERGGMQDSRKIWITLMLAEMAQRQDKLDESDYWLERFPSDKTAYLLSWADVKLALGKYDAVQRKLIKLFDKTETLEDSLLLRLAIAEKHAVSTDALARRDDIDKRIQLIEQRDDRQHAGDIALYYLKLNKNSKKALQWAEINWQNSQEFKDKDLLERALSFSENNSLSIN